MNYTELNHINGSVQFIKTILAKTSLFFKPVPIQFRTGLKPVYIFESVWFQ
jgi:hypothetical protein